MYERHQTPVENMRDSLEGFGSLEAHTPTRSRRLLLLFLLPFRLYAIWRAKSLGFSNTEIESLIEKGKSKPLENFQDK
ncbi:hypothetical protein A2767_03885 [Candidatus Roizmanbacteria bacterium RIFCSPHIGHO2_01_FULL_35_10]|uniref:Uncharacterized protein n=1 Tax=Candidatus Roizmanbacteria bacterium RIFCSPLOWO2_01_FULL_35_13 TaxID=1802055 RepID=A0A1F7IA64_9BACT|nr:MAG: hypothetical protein A2767_03885 [Candidatus Roizmanbacteria bacterium RIFCSPHIGHO2_01_FULL_35_10]OGK40265.1 MAG: hypothetical protein A3A74_07200 [Candidatus Roizmanbacteria bacterium RIFCSPLOWO2_01_FULL_35_13]